MVGRRSTYAEVLGESDAPLALHKHLARYWTAVDAPQDDPGRRATRSTADPSTGAVAAVGFPVLDTFRNLVLRKVEGVDKLSFLAVNGAGEVSVLHSLFCVGESTGDFTAGDPSRSGARSLPSAFPGSSALSRSSSPPTSPSWGRRG